MINGHKTKKQSDMIARIVFIGPAVLAIVLLMIVPICYGFGISLTNYNIARSDKKTAFVGLANYIKVLKDATFLSTVQWTLVFAIIAVISSVGLGLIISLILNSKWLKRSSGLFRTIFVLPMMVAPVVAASVWYIIYAPIYGIINAFLAQININQINWFGDEFAAKAALLITETWLTTPFCALVLLTALQGVSIELYEAAAIEGAGKVAIFFRITLPLIRNFISLVVIMRLMDSLKAFDVVYNLTKGGPGISTETMGTYIYRTGFRYSDISLGSAAAFILFAIIGVIVILMTKITRSDID